MSTEALGLTSSSDPFDDHAPQELSSAQTLRFSNEPGRVNVAPWDERREG